MARMIYNDKVVADYSKVGWYALLWYLDKEGQC